MGLVCSAFELERAFASCGRIYGSDFVTSQSQPIVIIPPYEAEGLTAEDHGLTGILAGCR